MPRLRQRDVNLRLGLARQRQQPAFAQERGLPHDAEKIEIGARVDADAQRRFDDGRRRRRQRARVLDGIGQRGIRKGFEPFAERGGANCSEVSRTMEIGKPGEDFVVAVVSRCLDDGMKCVRDVGNGRIVDAGPVSPAMNGLRFKHKTSALAGEFDELDK